MVEVRRGEIPRMVVPFAAPRLKSSLRNGVPREFALPFPGIDQRRIRQAGNEGIIIVWYSFFAG